VITTLAPPASAISKFPMTAVEVCLQGELVEAIKAEASIKGISLPPDSTLITKASIRIDSLVAVAILCAVEPIVGFELPETVVRAGGYASLKDALDHMLPQIEAQWKKRKGAHP
jgi:hypothetical protein